MDALGPASSWLVDVWSVYHFLGWGLGTFIVSYFCKLKLPQAVFLALLYGFAWECLELNVVEPILKFHEPWWNRWLSDIIFDSGGGFCGWWALAKLQGLRVVTWGRSYPSPRPTPGSSS